MIFKHYATDEEIELEVVITSMKNETICKNKKTGELVVVYKDEKERYAIKGTSFLKIN